MLENMVIKIKIVLFPPKVTKFCEEIKQLATEWDWTKYKDLFWWEVQKLWKSDI